MCVCGGGEDKKGTWACGPSRPHGACVAERPAERSAGLPHRNVSLLLLPDIGQSAADPGIGHVRAEL